MDPCAPPSLHGAWWWCNRDFHSTNKKDKEITRDFINVTLGFTLLIRPKGSTDHLSVKRGYRQFSVSSSVGDFTLQAECELLIRTRDCCREARRRRHVLLFKTIIARFYGLLYISLDSPCLWESPTASSKVEPQTPSLTAEENFKRDSAAKSAAMQICREACRSANLYICKGEIYWLILVCNLPDTFSVF